MVDPLESFIKLVESLIDLQCELSRICITIPNLRQLLLLEVFPGFVTMTLLIFWAIWFERKLIAKVNLRYGPLHVGKYSGIGQVPADILKLTSKERIIPEGADRFLYRFIPVFAFAVASVPIFLLPYGPNVYVTRFEASALLALGVFTLHPLFLITIGWAANNKFTLIGGIRQAYQTFSYEIPFLLSAASVFALAGSFDFVNIVEAQSNIWYIVLLPLGAIVFFISFAAELESKPFDVPTGETEIVFGPQTEYTGIYFALIMGAQYTKLVLGSAIFALLFLGGYTFPIPIPVPSYFILLAKQVFVMAVILFVRAIYPRIRIDQVIIFCWKYLTPLAILNLLMAIGIKGLLL